MIFSIDFNSDEAIYIQLCHQIIMSIANDDIHEGDSLPSVRQMAEDIGINMHTVNKAYTILKQEGYIKLDRRYGAVIAVDADKIEDMESLSRDLRVSIAKAMCKDITSAEIHALVDDIISEFGIK